MSLLADPDRQHCAACVHRDRARRLAEAWIGLGHGLFLALAANHSPLGRFVGWDISPTSLERTRVALDRMGVLDRVRLNLHDAGRSDMFGDAERFDRIVMSEVLEHLEDPGAVLRSILPLLADDGRMWINVPINSPAPDHMTLFEDVESVERLVASCGLEPLSVRAFPMGGTSLDKALSSRLTISCAVTCRKTGVEEPTT